MAEKAEPSRRISLLAAPNPERLAAKHQQALFGDYFQILEVERDVDQATLAAAIVRLGQEFDPALGSSFSEEQLAKLRLIAVVLQDAASILSDPRLRSLYCARMRPGKGRES